MTSKFFRLGMASVWVSFFWLGCCLANPLPEDEIRMPRLDGAEATESEALMKDPLNDVVSDPVMDEAQRRSETEPIAQENRIERPKLTQMESFMIDTESSQTGVPKIILLGLKAYEKAGPEAAVLEWIYGGPIQNDPNAMKAAATFRQVQNFYGNYAGHDVLALESLTPKLKMVYLAMNFENGVIFCSFPCFRKGNDWVLTGKFNFNTDPSVILPERIFKKISS